MQRIVTIVGKRLRSFKDHPQRLRSRIRIHTYGAMAAEVASEPAATATDLPPLSASDFQAYNRISVHMDAYVRIRQHFDM